MAELENLKTVAVIGPGVVGCALGRLLSRRGYVVEAVAGRSLAQAQHAVEIMGAGCPVATPTEAARRADIVFITTPDHAIQEVCATVAAERGFRAGAVVIHCSGALPAAVLAVARNCSAAVAALHPLQSFASVDEAIELLPGTWFAFEGDAAAESVCDALVRALGGRLFRLSPESKPLYHAASCMASNYLVVLVHLAASLMERSGMSRGEAICALLPLLRGTLRNIGAVGTPRALTGPIARGDVETVTMHLRALREYPSEFGELYRFLGVETVRLAQAKGTLDAARAARLLKVLRTPAV